LKPDAGDPAAVQKRIDELKQKIQKKT